MSVKPKQMYVGGSKTTFGGNCFVVPGGSSWNLSDLKIEGSDYEVDYIQCLQTTAARVDSSKAYYFDNDVGENGDWCYLNSTGGKVAGEPVEEDERIIPAGTAFLVTFNSNNAKLTYSGEVQKGVDGKIKFPKVAKFQLFANPLPYDVNVCDLSIEGGDYETDYIECLQTNAARVDAVRAFYQDDDGMYYLNAASGKQGEPVEREDGMFIKAGEGVLAVFNHNAKLVFPAPKL